MWNGPVYYGTKYWYALLFCEKCERFTTHRTDAPQGSGTFNLYQLDWKCIECEEGEAKSKILLPCNYCGHMGGPL